MSQISQNKIDHFPMLIFWHCPCGFENFGEIDASYFKPYKCDACNRVFNDEAQAAKTIHGIETTDGEFVFAPV